VHALGIISSSYEALTKLGWIEARDLADCNVRTDAVVLTDVGTLVLLGDCRIEERIKSKMSIEEIMDHDGSWIICIANTPSRVPSLRKVVFPEPEAPTTTVRVMFVRVKLVGGELVDVFFCFRFCEGRNRFRGVPAHSFLDSGVRSHFVGVPRPE
jgi:hypothetical protein